MHPNGHFDLILPYVEGLRFIELASQYRLYPQRVMEVFGKQGKNQERLLIRMQRSVGTVVYEEPLIIFDSLSNYTQQFRLLTESYYLDKVYTKKVKSTC